MTVTRMIPVWVQPTRTTCRVSEARGGTYGILIADNAVLFSGKALVSLPLYTPSDVLSTGTGPVFLIVTLSVTVADDESSTFTCEGSESTKLGIVDGNS